jgi:dihydrofolate synthase / folylpolyglutamate synthase
MTYEQVIQYLYEKLPMYQRVGAIAFKKDLTNTLALCEALGNPQNNFKSIHIAGTNGKGSVSHFLSSIFQEAGYKTGLYTSPHLIDFRERIKINGEWISESFVIDFVDRIKPLIETIQPSFFEITVAMAFDYFAEEKVDIAVIETGLGGRLDSTNIITPELSVITNIGYDHKDMLGDTLALIAQEKAGIIKANTPVVIGELHPETTSVFKRKAELESSPIFYAEEQWNLCNETHGDFLEVTYVGVNKEEIKIKSPLASHYQTKNIKTVLAAISVINHTHTHNIDFNSIQRGIENVIINTGFLGRWQVVGKRPKIVLDCAHNTEGMIALLEQLKYEKYNQLHIIYGCVKDKDFKNILTLFPTNAKMYFTQPNINRAASVDELAEVARELKLDFASDPNVGNLYKKVVGEASVNDLILFTGSVFLVSDLLSLLNNN